MFRSRLISPSELVLVVLAIFGLLAVTQAPGTGDVNIWLSWLDQVGEKGLAQGYRSIAADYPPGALTLLHVASMVSESRSPFFAIKLLLWCFLIFTAAALSFSSKTRTVFLFSVALLLFGFGAVGLGYLDVLWAPFLILGLVFFVRDKLFLSGLFLSLAVFVKWQPIIVVPLISVYLIALVVRTRGSRESLARIVRFLAGITLSAVPWVLVFGVGSIFAAFQQARNHDFLSGNALNLPWLIGAFFGPQTEFPSGISWVSRGAVPLTAVEASTWLFYLSYLLAILLSWFSRDPKALLSAALLPGAVGYFLFAPGAHENHLFLAALLASVCLRWAPKDALAKFLVPGILYGLNLFVFYGLAGGRVASRNIFGVDITIPLAFVEILALTLLFLLPPTIALIGRIDWQLLSSKFRGPGFEP